MSETGLSECVQQPFEWYLGFYFASEQTQSLLHETRGHLARLRYVFGSPEPADHLPCRDLVEVRDASSSRLPHRPRVFHKIAMARALSIWARRNGSPHEEVRRLRQDRACFQRPVRYTTPKLILRHPGPPLSLEWRLARGAAAGSRQARLGPESTKKRQVSPKLASIRKHINGHSHVPQLWESRPRPRRAASETLNSFRPPVELVPRSS